MSVLKSNIPMLEQKSNLMIRNLASNVDRFESFDIYNFIARCTLDMFCAGSSGTDMHFQEGSSCSYLHHLEEILELAMVRIMNPLLHPDWVYRWTSMYRMEEKALKEFHQPAKNIQLLMRKSSPTLIDDYMSSMKRIGHVDIEIKIKPVNRNSGAEKEIPMFGGKSHGGTEAKTIAFNEYLRPAKDILFLPRNSPSSIADGFKSSMKRNGHVEGIEQDLSGYIYAGHDTSALTISNTLLLLAMHPDVQERAVAEIREYYGAFDEDIQYETLQQLEYLEMVLKECLRLFPVAPIIGRQTTQEIALGKNILPVGVDVLINISSIHRNPAYWGEDADQFRPERFATNLCSICVFAL
ncbi:hypothetical protein AND_000552 [Anopheles darlingi]|uniref:Cytochrome P450 n=1 Tax=Anopheles darlingi TaxID=43151 RepID=W5JVX9_ANODA|nr:hypothetical protein AND_000552 [Anopheles darlingi]